MNKNKNKRDLCFVDTNSWLYAFIEAQNTEKSKLSKSLIKEIDIIISTQIINEICFNLLKKTQFSEEDLTELIVSFYGKYSVVEIDKEILLKACKLREKFNFSFWDSIIVASALDANARYLYSEDLHDGLLIEKNLIIVNPFKTILSNS